MKRIIFSVSHSLLVFAVATLAIPAGMGPAAAAEETSLFNGRDLADWQGNDKVWRVEDGIILGGSLDGNPRNEFLATRKSFGDFVLTFEYRLKGTEGFVNGGVQFHSKRIADPPNEMIGYQADIGAGFSGALYDESRRRKMLAQPSKELLKKTEKPGEWNSYEIRAQGKRIQLLLNGVKTVDYTETDKDIAQAGLIALQIHGGCKAVIAFRKITIIELDAAPDDAGQSKEGEKQPGGNRDE